MPSTQLDDTVILDSVKRPLGIPAEVTEFDIDITMHVNSAFFSLNQLGIGPETPFYIDSTTTWSSFETSIPKHVVLDYVFLKTKMVFDPPTSSSVVEAYNDRISELEFRMNVAVDTGGYSDSV